MILFSRVFVLLGGFLIIAGAIYGAMSSEYEGLTLMITVAGGALLIGGYLMSVVHRARQSLAAQREAGLEAEPVEPHVAPTIWPLVFAISAIGLIVGTVSARWVLVPGAVLFVVAGLGWTLDIRRQWGHTGDTGHDTGSTRAHEP